ncbi:Terpenoid cylases/protein prenyltransferase alpha-alpha toroid [Metarhizium album ARSEF 1941]|uniref:Terpenoid cylases/protein prenyltransferase alpha-alpha toroid n=1 Tax=Metarhizium album (strain ARSEF 1941) TaxID=1081103 RepID=A0A0B2WLK7_METAS|nr:Terpenoid cylases/protein prenyltransferase alpha-alpha toroid [Metarhizium album ARSEF 1941]KHN93905.1 Terpenoid cylases/protein prenyltransferase alpha-alpha toroid [Metarhizium album ARSEF 1941]
MATDIEGAARSLVSSMAKSAGSKAGTCTLSVSVYDTAWVAMVDKQVNGGSVPLFPECFQCLLDAQLPDGSWESYAGTVDGILNTMAALLALKKRCNGTRGLPNIDLKSRCFRAETALRLMFERWDITQCDRVGFEMVIPSLLRLLEQHNTQIDFSGRELLMQMHDEKMSGLYTRLSGRGQTTLIHSLEAFVGRLDYGEMKHYLSPGGSMMGSPSSTAAYLMFSPSWDERAEAYLRLVTHTPSHARQKGGVPFAFPTTIFELSWVTVTLLEAGFTVQDLGESNVGIVKDFLSENLRLNNGLASFAPNLLPDADDTVMALSAVYLLGERVSLKPLFETFEVPTHFRTYEGERNPSLSVNCNVLLCLLRRHDVYRYTAKVAKVASYLTEAWDGPLFKDKWNESEQYLTMLLAKALVLLLARRRANELDGLLIGDLMVEEQIPAMLLDIVNRLFCSQEKNGSWESKHEVTAYALLALVALADHPWMPAVDQELRLRLRRGRDYLQKSQSSWGQGNHVWIGKVAFSVSNFSAAYCLAAVKATQQLCLGFPAARQD